MLFLTPEDWTRVILYYKGNGGYLDFLVLIFFRFQSGILHIEKSLDISFLREYNLYGRQWLGAYKLSFFKIKFSL